MNLSSHLVSIERGFAPLLQRRLARSLVYSRCLANSSQPSRGRAAGSSAVQNSYYRDIPKETRNAMTKLSAHIDEVDAWYATLSVWEKLHWKNPQTVAKHCPQHLLPRTGHNINPPHIRARAAKKKRGNPEAERLRALLVKIINDFVMPVDPEKAKTILRTCVWRWQERFMQEGFDGLLRDKTRPSRIPGSIRVAFIPVIR